MYLTYFNSIAVFSQAGWLGGNARVAQTIYCALLQYVLIPVYDVQPWTLKMKLPIEIVYLDNYFLVI